jgi:hypothetical protein
MTIGKASALAAGFVGAVALGVAIGPSITHRGGGSVAMAPAAHETAPDAAKAPARTRPASRPAAAKPASSAAPAMFVEASKPELHERLKPVLNRGTRMSVAAEGFRDAEQFATVAHAARNTNIPFMVLKYRVLNEKQSLAEAIRGSNPDIDAKAEVSRARAAAKADVAAISS